MWGWVRRHKIWSGVIVLFAGFCGLIALGLAVGPPPKTTTTADAKAVAASPAAASSRAASPAASPLSEATGTAVSVLAKLPVKAAGSMSGYSRDAFGPAWTDNNDDALGHNSCDTRDDILKRDLTAVTYKSGDCTVQTGTLHDPYTGKTIHFTRGVGTSTAVQIDHVVALGGAWTTGARNLTAQQRVDLANDGIELLASDGPTNEGKGDDDASEWLPPAKAFDCQYVADQIAVKAKYKLWVTSAEQAAMRKVLATCPSQPVGAGKRPTVKATPTQHTAPSPTHTVAPATHRAVPTHAPAPVTHAPAPTHKAYTPPPPAPARTTQAPPAGAVVHPGAFCAPEGARGVTDKGTAMVCGPASDGRNRWHSG
jgi:hypothetical protein